MPSHSGVNHVKEKHTVLVIDDYPPAIDAVKFALKDEFECLSADSGRQGLDILRATPVDVVILDIRMPEMDGIQTLRYIRDMGIDSQVILLTAYGSLETARKAVRYGAFDYLIKPFDTTSLRDVVREAIQKKGLLEKQEKDTDLKKLTDTLSTRLAEASRMAWEGELSSESLKEMKNPLTAVLGYTQLLLKNLREKRFRLFSAKSMRYLSLIEEEANQCVKIASRLNALSEDERAREGAVVNQIMLNVGALLRPQCSMRAVELAVSPPTEKVIVDTSSDDLHAVLISLVLNSLEAIEGPGEIDLRGYTFTRESPSVALLSEQELEALPRGAQDSLVAVEVTDTGRGIAPEHLDKIFDPSFSARDDEFGKWLGLSICKQKVERSRGHIGVVSSRPGETTIRIILPVSSRV